MKFLLDTCTFLWIILEDEQLSSTARELFVDATQEVYLSSISTWEIALKHGQGKLPLPALPERFVPEQRIRHGIEPLPLDELATFHLYRLPRLHRDPFDRMLVCQAIEHGMVVLTPDRLITQYPVKTVW
jgi:PIN domain nuclease of toxin-antitoxin system